MRENGDYDWAKVLLEVPRPGSTPAQMPNTSALPEYTRPGLRVVHVPNKGLAVVAHQGVPAGALLLVEDAFARGPSIGDALEDAWGRLGRGSTLEAPARLKAQVFALAGSHHASLAARSGRGALYDTGSPLEAWGDGLPVGQMTPEDVGHRIQRNAMASVCMVDKPDGYTAVETKAGVSEVALYPKGSLLNHDCSPNCVRLPLGPSLVMRAGRDIAPGEELTCVYFEVRQPFAARAAELREKWGFDCACARCAYESSLPAKLQAELGRSYEAFQRFKATGQASEDDLRSQVRSARRCVDKAGSSASLTPERRCWLLAGAYVLLAFELAVGLRMSGRQTEAEELLAEVDDVYSVVMPSSAMHAATAHLRSLSYFEGPARCRVDAKGVPDSLRRSVLVHGRCYGDGARTLKLLARRALPPELQKLIATLEPAPAVSPSQLPGAAAPATSEQAAAPPEAATSARPAPADASARGAPAAADERPAARESTEPAHLPEFTDLPDGRLRADLPLDQAPLDGDVQLSQSGLRVASRSWDLPCAVDPSDVRVSWLRKQGVLRVEAVRAVGEAAAAGSYCSGGGGGALGALD